jgi:putative FmdB family regulatory protein
MPIYEFFCRNCNTLFNFFSARVNTEKIPRCPRCAKPLAKQLSSFSTIGRAKKPSEDGMPDIDEFKMERALGELANEAQHITEEDPKQMADLMRRFSEKSGIYLGDGMEEALKRLESGEDPEKIEQEMGDILEKDDPFALTLQKGKKARRKAPEKDDTLYFL